ncbi:MAG: DUF6778 family protein [Paracoccaceae bacterium]
MKRPILLITIGLTLALAACSNSAVGQFGRKSDGPAKLVDVTQLPSMRVIGVSVEVPETLVVSERNSIKPKADIVWREDPFGDRYGQVKTIVEDAINTGVAPLRGELPVRLQVELVRFHALTERTRFSIGGVHEIDFLLTVTNANTGEVVIPTYLVNSSLPGFGGEEALAAVRLGQTQKVRISSHIAAVIHSQLTGNPVLGMPQLDLAAEIELVNSN